MEVMAACYERELDAKIGALSSLIESVVVLLLGFVVAGILISMYLPMFELGGVRGGMRAILSHRSSR
jgi:type IV pilus assembly protein PilC